MKRLIALMVCLVAASQAVAAPGSGKDAPVMLDVQSAPAPVPALKYQLLPELAEMNPGNAVPAYLKCFAEQNQFFFSKESIEERERLLSCPLTDIKPASLKDYGSHALRQADHAARLEYCDWNLLPQMREHGYMLLIPEVQQVRTLAAALAVRCRVQIADKDFDGAINSLKTIFALARHTGEHPTVISGLVGVAIAQIGCNRLEELIQQPDAPNLYWALTDLPNPLVDNRRGVSADRMMSSGTLSEVLDPKRPWAQDEVPANVKKLTELGIMLAEIPMAGRKPAEAWMQERLKDEAWLTAARKYLTDRGYPAGAVAKYPAEQVLFFKLYSRARLLRDEALKWMNVPYWQAEEAFAELTKAPAEMEDKIAQVLVMAVPKVRTSHARLEQRLGLLRVVEAIRLDGSKNGGKLPAKLTELSVPLPLDPVTGKAFEYKVDGMTAVLEGKPTRFTGLSGSTTHYKYEVRLRK
jgi:hypothetical protein